MKLSKQYIVVNAAGVVVNAGHFPIGDPAVVIAGEAARGNTAIFGIDGFDHVGCIYQDGEFVPQPKSRAAIATEIADRRWQKEVGGTIWNGHPVNTEREAQSKLNAAITSGVTLGVWTAGWKFDDGVFRTVTQDELKSIGAAVATHVGNAYAWEATELHRLSMMADSDLIYFEMDGGA
ncbi:DUF4376 domain-containing protein [Deefgea rivuli]|uniref:DUF4376 domain-containing protein n=1 Tax=Deefgea rivuli TaxID=400948 RepID=UPI000482D511|nr:DUF4376 domain-containing protein [Deefgea rivuli]